MPNRESSAHSGIFYVIFFTLLLGLPQATVQAQETL